MLDLPWFQRACRDREKSLTFVFHECMHPSAESSVYNYKIKVCEYAGRSSLAHTYTHKIKCLCRREIL